MTQMDAARAGTVTDEMHAVAVAEHRSDEFIRDGVAKGTIAIPANPAHKALKPCGVGTGLRTKANVNLGISGENPLLHSVGFDAQAQQARSLYNEFLT